MARAALDSSLSRLTALPSKPPKVVHACNVKRKTKDESVD